MQASKIRSNRKTSRWSLGDPEETTNLPGLLDARSSFHQGHNNLGRVTSRKHSLGSLQDASFGAQRRAGNHPTSIGMVPASKSNKSFPERPLSGHFALREQAGKLTEEVSHPPPRPSLTLYQLGLTTMSCLSLELRLRHCRKQCDNLLDKASARTRQTTTTTTTTTTPTTNNNNNNNNNNDDNNDNNNNTTSQRSSLQSLDQNKESQESGLNSFDLDNDNPETELSSSDLDMSSLATKSFSLGTLGQPMMAIGFSLGSLTQDSQKGERAGTLWDPSLEMDRDSFGKQKPKKKVSFDEVTLEAYKAECQQ